MLKAPTDSFVFSPVTSAAGDVEEQSFHTVEEMRESYNKYNNLILLVSDFLTVYIM